MRENQKLIIFVKAPVPGKVKTRLVPALTYEQAAELYKSWAQEIFKTASCLGSAEIVIAYEPHPDFPDPRWLSHTPRPDKIGIPLLIEGNNRRVPFFLQKGENLGERLRHAFERAFQRGSQKVVIIGSDSPGLPLVYLQQSFEALEKNDLVLGPTQDGGYYLIGLRRKIIPELFTDIPWSSSEVFSKTMDAAQKLNLHMHLLPEYFDMDTAEDLTLLKRFEGFKEKVKIQ